MSAAWKPSMPFVLRPSYPTYKSPYGPIYKASPNFHGIDARQALRFGGTIAAFTGVAGVFCLYFFSEVPRVRKDIMQKIPVVGDLYVKEIPASDNPF
ncbi:hypothetical protein L228DRAFT_244130 [Xylona heveae TC161]|uniref:Uncharacterized protein n=1 Tax=Xylona heveae (strain CBS 132557 / TC161) TaxID=1328760 RepID=A0A165ISG6_XYLHT|nr:hypothetical protein L228DRAFT_244130 [Xylona heveae TC161]KZF25320.1 hypothetical protein L228DRAFT_244130 [Xylona heveae TC161]